MSSANGNPTQNALLELSQQFAYLAANTKADSPTYKGYQLAMEHAAERARQAAEDHADFGTTVTIPGFNCWCGDRVTECDHACYAATVTSST